MTKRILPFTILGSIFFALTAGHTRADEISAHETSAREQPHVAITVSPLHMFVPMAELTVEARVAPKVGVAAIGGAGTYRTMDTNDRISLIEAGASARYYAAGSFRTGLQLGFEALYVHAFTNASNIDVKAAGLALSPFAGYKWTHSSGLTLEGELGVSYMVARAEAATGQMAERKAYGPMLNLQVGYSF
ncbi:MAG TPA: hypothetical protein VMZ53_27830 [Kofleriaceae bacterium]|nr:hypothetical protein [Kofleriaceae bacterium]